LRFLKAKATECESSVFVFATKRDEIKEIGVDGVFCGQESCGRGRIVDSADEAAGGDDLTKVAIGRELLKR